MKNKSERKIRYKLTCSKCDWFHIENSRDTLIRSTGEIILTSKLQTKKKTIAKCINCGNKYDLSKDIRVIEEDDGKKN